MSVYSCQLYCDIFFFLCRLLPYTFFSVSNVFQVSLVRSSCILICFLSCITIVINLYFLMFFFTLAFQMCMFMSLHVAGDYARQEVLNPSGAAPQGLASLVVVFMINIICKCSKFCLAFRMVI